MASYKFQRLHSSFKALMQVLVKSRKKSQVYIPSNLPAILKTALSALSSAKTDSGCSLVHSCRVGSFSNSILHPVRERSLYDVVNISYMWWSLIQVWLLTTRMDSNSLGLNKVTGWNIILCYYNSVKQQKLFNFTHIFISFPNIFQIKNAVLKYSSKITRNSFCYFH